MIINKQRSGGGAKGMCIGKRPIRTTPPYTKLQIKTTTTTTTTTIAKLNNLTLEYH